MSFDCEGVENSRPTSRKTRLPRQYVVEVKYAPAGAGDREALAKARRHAFAAVLKMQGKRGGNGASGNLRAGID